MKTYKRVLIICLLSTIQSVMAQNIKYADDFLILNKDSLPKVLLVGTFHFEYYNLDAYKVDKDKQIDVLTNQKQKELKELLDYISMFKPTKICIEAFSEWNAIKKYKEYKAGQKQVVRDERYQIAFKLMDRFKLDTVYSINAESIANDFQSTKDSTLFMPYLQNLYNGYSDKDNVDYVRWRNYKTTLTTKISLLKYFKYLNSQNNLRRDFGAYLVGDYKLEKTKGADILAIDWYNRNLRIFRNLQNINAKPNDRILVLFGSGHIAILDQLLASSPEYKYIKFNDLKK
jgi:Family of unknown function (DUF5694)